MIGDFAFNSNSIDTLVLPASLQTIGKYAFWGFELDTVIFAVGSHIYSIGYSAFANNSDLKMSFPTPVKEGSVFDRWEDDMDYEITFSGGDEITNFQSSYTAYFKLAPGTSIIELSSNLTFGEVTNTTSQLKALTIKNTGNASFSITAIDLPQGFTTDLNNGEVAAQSETTANITFSPTESRSYSGMIVVHSNATSGIDSIPISGYGVPEVLQSIDAVADIHVENGTDVHSIMFPATLSISTNGNTSTIDISGLDWTCPNYDKVIANTYLFSADIADILAQKDIDNGLVSTNININVVVAEGTAINSGKVFQVMCYPNPVLNELTVVGHDEFSLEMSDILGNKLLIQNFNNKATIDMSKHSAGMYILTLKGNNESTIIKVIKD